MAHTLVSIGDFSRMTHLTVKALRYYHDVGVLTPAAIDPDSGYRRYSTEQVPVAQVVRRLRDLDMPIDAVRDVVSAPDVAARNAAIAEHLSRMEEQLAQTRSAVTSLRTLLQPVKRGGAPDRVPSDDSHASSGDQRPSLARRRVGVRRRRRQRDSRHGGTARAR
ncbi:MerR family transcriptional regulator [Humibacter ginsenosidimutans]|uniref:MerR family transcriptional regulator n=1 Tax=Humibacter ginsenosidimutans TaxID=2599293 RepID=UPI00143CE7F9|nr:helix-turn-helix domain-containing protein [Humibacter ginsenosidimutans]